MAQFYNHAWQRTIKKAISTMGIGLHSGANVHLTLKPAPANHGIVFHRIDQNPVVVIKALVSKVVGGTYLASVIQEGDIRVSTVEHLLSACAGLGVDNLIVELDAEEVPIMDGSAATFSYLLKEACIMNLPEKKCFIRVKKVVEIKTTEKWARLSPFNGFKVDFHIAFEHPKISQTGQFVSIDLDEKPYNENIGRARTFGFVNDLEVLRGMGLARGGSLENAIVMDEYEILNAGPMRYNDEFVRHKVLDAIGDLYLAGLPLLAHYEGYRSGHAFNNKLLSRLLEDDANYDIIDTPKQTTYK